ncbi:MAG: pantoate--beta-alanine ligase [Flavobacterium lindanitolerans]|uniref:pantoate--beta-alanine ligase n=1 Tax=Flavobacterium lindanitolerans TaxID=428988 RepID=UPI001A53FBB6|nr:pantoate--beta-alanine ligase [Flavobacterium lindanitolerans]MBL7868423.1 pantoate--beta-alanine ligase [Flavobacterium lindanitolerans]
MLIFNRQEDLKKHLRSVTKENTTIGFVPTMGALHQGHLSLIEKSLTENQVTVVSIFVNPTQFNNPEDLEKYPRTLEKDTQKIETVSKDVIIFAPSVEDIYEGNTTAKAFDFDGLENQMEGKHRPGHFDGVGTIVKRLFEIVNPTNAYFGEKDFQQLQIVKKMVEKHQMPVNVIGCPIYRESNGLAMSSRNERLTPQQKEDSSLIYKTLKTAKEKFGTESAKEITDWVESVFEKNPEFRLEYFQIADEKQLLPIGKKDNAKKYRAFIAVFINSIRLIDNISLN